MTIQEFLELNEMDKMNIIMQSGRLINQRVETGTRIFLYRVESFYVSACYHTTSDQLTEIFAYIETDQSVPHFRKSLTSIHPAERQYDTPEI